MADETKRDKKENAAKGPKFCPCGKQAIDFGDGVLKCPQHFTQGDDLVDSAPVTGDFVEADEGTNKGATELAVQEPKMSDAGKELAKEPTQDATLVKEGSAEDVAGNSEEATNKANAQSGKAATSVGGEKFAKSEKNAATKSADEKAGISSQARADAAKADAASGDTSKK